MSNIQPSRLSDPAYNPGPRHEILQASDAEDFDISAIDRGLRRIGRANGRELLTFAIRHTARRQLPYGKWTCKDGREVIFNREYQPIYQRINGEVSYADRDEYVKDIETCEMFWHDGNSPIDFMVKHLGEMSLDAQESRACRKSLLKVLTIAHEFTPIEHSSVSGGWSLDNVLPSRRWAKSGS